MEDASLTFVLDAQGSLLFTINPYCPDGSSASMVGVQTH
jgi:hypothetical protein